MLASKHGQDENVATLDAKVINITFTFQGYIYIYWFRVGSWIHYQQLAMHLFCHKWCVPKLYLQSRIFFIIASCKHNYYITCKHMYYIYNVHKRRWTHHLTLSWNDVEDILKLGLNWLPNLFVPLDWIIGNIISNSWFGIFQWSLSRSWILGSNLSCIFLFMNKDCIYKIIVCVQLPISFVDFLIKWKCFPRVIPYMERVVSRILFWTHYILPYFLGCFHINYIVLEMLNFWQQNPYCLTCMRKFLDLWK